MKTLTKVIVDLEEARAADQEVLGALAFERNALKSFIETWHLRMRTNLEYVLPLSQSRWRREIERFEREARYVLAGLAKREAAARAALGTGAQS